MSSSTNDKEVNTAVQDAVVAAAVDSTTVDDDHSGGGGDPVVGRETKGNDDDADAMVDDHLVDIDRYIRHNIMLVDVGTVGTPVSMVFNPQFSVLLFQNLLSNTILHEVNFIRITLLFTNIVCTAFVLLVNQYTSVIIITFRLSSNYRTTTPTIMVIINCS
jgi:hypothetical protein